MTNVQKLDIEAIRAEAQKAAFLYDRINDACPYPYDTMAGVVFKTFFLATKKTMPPQKETP